MPVVSGAELDFVGSGLVGVAAKSVKTNGGTGADGAWGVHATACHCMAVGALLLVFRS